MQRLSGDVGQRVERHDGGQYRLLDSDMGVCSSLVATVALLRRCDRPALPHIWFIGIPASATGVRCSMPISSGRSRSASVSSSSGASGPSCAFSSPCPPLHRFHGHFPDHLWSLYRVHQLESELADGPPVQRSGQSSIAAPRHLFLERNRQHGLLRPVRAGQYAIAFIWRSCSTPTFARASSSGSPFSCPSC